MPRVVSIFLPTWSTDRVRRKLGAAAPSPDTPLVLLGQEGRRRVVLAVDHAAHEVGLHVGMPATKAQALVPGLVTMDAEPKADAEGLERLAAWALRYSPMVSADTPDGIVIDTEGADHLHGGETSMLRALMSKLHEAGFAVRAAIADSWGAAHALARYHVKPDCVVPVGGNEAVVVRLPIEGLRLPKDVITGLREVGFEQVGELLNRPRAPLALRFGPEVCRRLDQLMGRVSEPISPVRPEDVVDVRRPFAEPIAAAETIARYITQLVPDLCAALEAKGLGAKRLDLVCHRVDSRYQAVRIGMALPTRDIKRLTRMLCEKIETIDPGFGIELMVLSATLAEPMGAKQVISSLAADPETDISGLVDTLANRIGEKRLYRFEPVDSDVPERSVARVAPLSPDIGKDWPKHWPRPTRLLARPELVEAMALLPDQPPVAFTWRGVRRKVKRADGPERVFGEWWKRDAELSTVRDYFQIEDEAGERYWLYRAGDGEHADTGSQQWFMHGTFA